MKEREIREELLKLLNRRSWFLVAKVTKVSGETCTIDANGLEIEGVRLKAVEDGDENSLMVTPKVGSMVLVADISGGELRELGVIAYSGVETIQINGGNNGGIININELVQKLNELVETFNAHTHIVTTSSGSGTAERNPGLAARFEARDFEDDKIKH